MEVRGILMIILMLVFLYIVIKVIYSTTAPLSFIQDGTTMTTIQPKSLTGGSNGANAGNFTYSVWFYVNDWNYRYGEPKVIFGRMGAPSTSSKSSIPGVSGTDPCPSVVLGAMQNNLSISLACYPGTNTGSSTSKTTNPAPAASTATTKTNPAPAATSTSSSTSRATSGVAAAASNLYSNLGSSASGISKNFGSLFSNLEPFASMTANSTLHTCNVSNVPVQKWVNLLISVYGRTLDVYIDGKLVKTCLLPGIAKINNTAPIYLTPSGGFAGWTSKLQYWPNATDPQTAWNIYAQGYGGSNMFGQYKVKVALYNGDAEQNSLTI